METCLPGCTKNSKLLTYNGSSPEEVGPFGSITNGVPEPLEYSRRDLMFPTPRSSRYAFNPSWIAAQEPHPLFATSFNLAYSTSRLKIEVDAFQRRFRLLQT